MELESIGGLFLFFGLPLLFLKFIKRSDCEYAWLASAISPLYLLGGAGIFFLWVSPNWKGLYLETIIGCFLIFLGLIWFIYICFKREETQRSLKSREDDKLDDRWNMP